MRGWAIGISGPNSALSSGISEMRNRSRDLTRKFPLLNGAYDTICSNIVGTGIKVIPQTSDIDARRLIKQTWDYWSRECDSEGINSFSAILELLVRERFETGEVFIRRRPRRLEDGYLVPYQIQILEAEHCPYEMIKNLPNGGYIMGGVEFDRLGKRVAYHMYRHHPGDNLIYKDSLETFRIPAEEVIHYYKPLRAGQVRGIPECFSSHATMRELMEYDEAEVVRKKIASTAAGFITSPAPQDIFNEDNQDQDADLGEAVAHVEPGSLINLNPGESVVFNNPAESGVSYDPFLKHTLRSLAASLNMSYEEFSCDLSGVNFSSIRTGLNQSQRKYRKEQQRLIDMVCYPIFRRFFEAAVLAGVFKFNNAQKAAVEYGVVQWQAPGWAYVNPLQEVNAQKEQIKAGLKSRSQVIAEMGGDAEEVDEMIAKDREREKRLGLSFDVSLIEQNEKNYVSEEPEVEVAESERIGKFRHFLDA
jgi:lambda family phage portal protein